MSRGRRIGWFVVLLAVSAAALVALSACGKSSGSKAAAGVEKLYSPQNEELDVYDLSSGKMTVLIPVSGWVNGQVCIVPDGTNSLLMAEDKNEEKGVRSGWSIFSSDGKFVRKIPAPRSPTNEPKTIDPMGCAFDRDKRLFVSDVGEEDFTAASGKLIVFFPPDYTTYCILSDTLHTAGTVAVDDDTASVLVAESVPPGDVRRFSPPLPDNADECEAKPPKSSVFIQDPNVGTPAGIARAPNGNWYVSSVFVPPAINEYDKDGKLVRNIVTGQDIGNPEGIAVDSKGTIYYADLALAAQQSGLPGPERGKGTVRKIEFDSTGLPQAPQIIGSGLSFPDAVSVLRLPVGTK